MSSLEYLTITAIAMGISAIAIGIALFVLFSQQNAFNNENAILFLQLLGKEITKFSYFAPGSYKLIEFPPIVIRNAIYCNNTLAIFPYNYVYTVGNATIAFSPSASNYLQFLKYKNSTLVAPPGEPFFFYKLFYDNNTHTINYSIRLINTTSTTSISLNVYYPNMSLFLTQSFNVPVNKSYNGSFSATNSIYFLTFNNSFLSEFSPSCFNG